MVDSSLCDHEIKYYCGLIISNKRLLLEAWEMIFFVQITEYKYCSSRNWSHSYITVKLLLGNGVVRIKVHFLAIWSSSWFFIWYFHLSKNKLGCLGGSVSWVSNFGSGRDLTVHEFQPHIGLSAVRAEPASDPLSPSRSAPPPLAPSLSLSLSLKNKHDKIQSIDRSGLPQTTRGQKAVRK